MDSVNVMRDMATGRARGFAFVEMASDDDAQKAIDQLNNTDFGGRNLTVNEARPKTARGGGGGGGGRGGVRRRRWWRRRPQARAALVTATACSKGSGLTAGPFLSLRNGSGGSHG